MEFTCDFLGENIQSDILMAELPDTEEETAPFPGKESV